MYCSPTLHGLINDIFLEEKALTITSAWSEATNCLTFSYFKVAGYVLKFPPSILHVNFTTFYPPVIKHNIK